MVTVHPIETIVSDPAVRGGPPIIAGYLYRGLSPEMLAVNFRLDMAGGIGRGQREALPVERV